MSVRHAVFIALLSALVGRGLFALTDQEKKELFLRAREEMRTVPAATPRPATRPKPKPAAPRPSPKGTPAPVTRPESTPSPEPTPQPTRNPAPPGRDSEEKTTPVPRPTPPPAPTPLRTPAPTPERAERPAATPQPKPSAPITIQKSGLADDEGYEPPPPREKRGWFGFKRPGVRYRYLSEPVREAIDRAPVKKRRWHYIVVHNSGSRQGNAKIFEYYHRRVRKMPNGMAYHFVIGNGTSSGNGQIEIGNRWTRQINGGHVHSDYLNNIALGICLVGDYNRHDPTPQQLEALAELIRYLQKRCGKVDGRFPQVKSHKAINPPRWPTDCPGDRFPYKWLSRF